MVGSRPRVPLRSVFHRSEEKKIKSYHCCQIFAIFIDTFPVFCNNQHKQERWGTVWGRQFIRCATVLSLFVPRQARKTTFPSYWKSSAETTNNLIPFPADFCAQMKASYFTLIYGGCAGKPAGLCVSHARTLLCSIFYNIECRSEGSLDNVDAEMMTVRAHCKICLWHVDRNTQRILTVWDKFVAEISVNRGN